MSSSLTTLLHRLFGLFQHFQRDVSGSDLAQRNDGRFIVFPFDGGFRAVRQAPGALGGQQHQIEQIGFVL